MKTCEDCIHYDVCFKYFDLVFGIKSTKAIEKILEENCDCAMFKDKTRYIEKPCNIGDKVYLIYHVSDAILDFISSDDVTKFGITTRGILREHTYDFDEIGKTVFLSREEAEKALAERNKEKGKEKAMRGGEGK